MRRFPAIAVILFSSLPCTVQAAAGTYLVLPFFNASANANIEWIGESAAEAIRETLVHYEQPAYSREKREEAAHHLSVRPGTKLTKASILKLAMELDASRVIDGDFAWTPAADSSSPSRGTVSLSARVIDVRGVTRLPEIVESGPMTRLAQIQTRLTWRVLRHALADRSPDEQEFLESHPPVRIDAMESYIRGLMAPALDQKHRYFSQSARLDPDFSEPRMQLGRMQWEEQSYRAAGQWLKSIQPASAYYVEANYLLGLCRYHTGDYAGALAAFDVVAQKNPIAEVLNNLGVSQFRHRTGDAVSSLSQAAQQNPLDTDVQFNIGYVLWRQGDLESAAERFRTVLELDPDDASARQLLERCQSNSGPRRGDLSSEGLERLKENYEEIAYRRLGLNAPGEEDQ